MLLLLTALAALAASVTTPDKKTVYVEVDGGRYRVTTKGDDVEVTRKAAIVRYNMDERDRLRRAVQLATGCAIVDELEPSAKLRGRLACSGEQQR